MDAVLGKTITGGGKSKKPNDKLKGKSMSTDMKKKSDVQKNNKKVKK
jgi:hypothetical protein